MKNSSLVFLLTFSLLLFSNDLFSQAPVVEWQNTIGGNNLDGIISIHPTNDNGYICGAVSSSNISGDKSENCLGMYDYWVIKLDSSGKVQWENTIQGSNEDDLYSVKQTADGGYICGGYSNSTAFGGDKSENSNGLSDYWILKLDMAGNILWQNTIGGGWYDELRSISQTSDGGYICGGMSSSTISGDKTENSISADYWIVKLDSAGIIQWQNNISADDYDNLTTVSQTTDGGYICGGWSSSGNGYDKTENSLGFEDYWILKLDSIGNIQWQNTIGGNESDWLQSITQTNDGGYICGGYSESNATGDKSENSIGAGDYWILKLDSAGNIQWQNTIGGTENEVLFSVYQTINGEYICGGWSSSDISGDKTVESNGLNDFWVIKLDVSGNIKWQKAIGGNNNDNIYHLSIVSDGSYICGGSSSSDISGDKTEVNSGPSDCWVVKITENYNTISGTLFDDLNGNNILDTAETLIPYNVVTEFSTGRYALTDIHGNYNLSVFDTGNFNVYTIFNYYNIVPLNHTAHFFSFHLTDSLNDFAFQPNGVYNDLRIKLTPLGSFRPGNNAHYRLDYMNVGTTSLSGDVVFYIDTTLIYVNSTLSPTTISSDSIVWSTGLLTPFQSGSITVTVHVNQNVPIGTLIHSIARIFPVAGDVNPQNNVSSWEVFVTGSYDPNDILVNRAEILTTEFPNPPWLEYIIRFQNTGTDTAFMVKIFNSIDTSRLDLNSFEFETSSHPVNVSYNYFARRFEYNFPDILLPDSNVNEMESHGFIRYRIKPLNTLVLNDSIKNKALIFFDYNEAVATNTALTIITNPVGIFSPSKDQTIKVFPNPASNQLFIQSPNIKGVSHLQVFDLAGRELLNENFQGTNDKFVLNITNLNSGLYMLRVVNNEKYFHARFVKE